MISPKITKALLSSATKERKDAVIIELLNHVNGAYSYDDAKASHILEMLVDDNAIVKPHNINLDYIEDNLNLVMYNHDKYNIKDIKLESIDNIEAEIRVSYKYLEKINEDRTDVSYSNSTATISYIGYPGLLK